MSKRRTEFLAAWMTVLFTSPNLAAQTETTTAETLFHKGFEAGERQDYASALALFRTAQAMEPRKSTLENIAKCLEWLGRTQEALETWDTFLAAYSSLMGTKELVRVTQRIHALEKKLELGHLDIRGTIEAEWFVDGISKGRLPQDQPLRLAAGEHVVRVKRPDALPLERRITIHPAGTLILEVDTVQLRLKPLTGQDKPRPRVPMDVYGAWLIGSSLGRTLNVDVLGACQGPCLPGLGFLAGIRFPQRSRAAINWDMAAGFVHISSDSQHQWTGLAPGNPIVMLNSTLMLQGAWISIGMWFRRSLGSSWQFTGSMGFASLFGVVQQTGSGELTIDIERTPATLAGETNVFFVRPVFMPGVHLSRRIGPVSVGLGVLGWLSPVPGPYLHERSVRPTSKCSEAPETNAMQVRACDLPGIGLPPSRAFGPLWYVAPMLGIEFAL